MSKEYPCCVQAMSKIILIANMSDMPRGVSDTCPRRVRVLPVSNMGTLLK